LRLTDQAQTPRKSVLVFLNDSRALNPRGIPTVSRWITRTVTCRGTRCKRDDRTNDEVKQKKRNEQESCFCDPPRTVAPGQPYRFRKHAKNPFKKREES
jgi:hypothetical protein